MPDEDGFELLREIRSLDPSDGGKVPVIAITGLSRPLDQMRAPAAGFDAILPKPFTPGPPPGGYLGGDPEVVPRILPPLKA